MAANQREAVPLLVQVRVADTFNHKKSSQVRVHQHLDMGQGEINWNRFFHTFGEEGIAGMRSRCVFTWEEREEDSSRFMRGGMRRYIDRYFQPRG